MKQATGTLYDKWGESWNSKGKQIWVPFLKSKPEINNSAMKGCYLSSSENSSSENNSPESTYTLKIPPKVHV